MIHFTTFIFTLLLAHIARAVPACGDVAPPEDMYNPTYDNEQRTLAACWIPSNAKYDDPKGDTKSVACKNLAHRYPHFKDIPGFPYIGAASNVQPHSPNCDKCWKLTDKKTHKFIYFHAIDTSTTDFVLSQHAYDALKTAIVNCTLETEPVPLYFCGLRSID
jgi:hypothetical protein